MPVGYLTGVAAEQVTAAYVSAVAAECAARAAAAARFFCDGQGAVSYGACVSSVAAEGAARAAAAAVASWYSVDLLVPDGRSSLAVARLWARTRVIKRKFAAVTRLRSRQSGAA